MAKEKPVELSYETAYEELQRILHELQEETVSIDDLSAKVQRAQALIRFCRERLRTTEEEIQGLIEE
jgi:exodeoxyribonuclease VII small subunit